MLENKEIINITLDENNQSINVLYKDIIGHMQKTYKIKELTSNEIEIIQSFIKFQTSKYEYIIAYIHNKTKDL